MLLLLLQYITVLFISTYIGKVLTSNLLKLQFANALHYFFVGIIGTVLIARIWALFGCIGIYLNIFLLLITTLSIVLNGNIFRHISISKTGKILVPIALLFILFFSSQQSISYDEALYHSSFISWCNEYGVLNGVANLHGRLGFNSNWHFFVAVFNFKSILTQPLNQLNGLMLLTVMLFFDAEKKLHSERCKFINVFSSLLFFPVILVYHFIDPSADYAVVLWTGILMYELYFWANNSNDKTSLSILLFISTVFLFTVKISVLPLGVLLLVTAPFILKDKKALVITSLVSITIVGLWFYSNYLLSGYIIYPYFQVDALNPVWKVPDDIVHADIEGIKYTPVARWTGLSYDVIKEMSFWQRFKAWFGGVRLFDKAFFAFTGIIVLSVVLVFRKSDKYQRWVIFWIITGFFFVALAVPDIRFYAVYLFFALAVIAQRFTMNIDKIISKSIITLVLLQALITLKLYTGLKQKVNNPAKNWHNGLAVNLIKAEPYPLSDKDSVSIDGIMFYTFNETKQQYAWNVVPSVYLPVNQQIKLIKQGDIAAGIYIAKEN